MLKQEIKTRIEKHLAAIGVADVPVIIDYPADPLHGDYSCNVALIAAKKLGKNPREFAIELAESLRRAESGGQLFEKVEVAGPGFLNFWIKDEALAKISADQEMSDIGKGKKVIVEYSSPNIAKPFTIGHLRSTIIGDAVANLLEAIGYEVFRDNHVGDWGTQFGKQIYAIKTWGNEEVLDKSERPVKELVALYVKFHDEAEKYPELEDEARAWFKKLEDGDIEARRLWQKCIDWSWKEFDKIYQELGVSFTENHGRGYGESFFEDKMGTVLEELTDKKLLEVGKEGAKIVNFPEETKTPPLMILKKDGATLYATRDLATDKFRLEKYGQDITIINEVGAEQNLYFQQLYTLEEMLGWFKKTQRVHVKHGLYRFKEGKMSTRKGNVIWLEDVLEEARLHAQKLSEDSDTNNAEQISVGALKWNDLKRDSKQDIAFDWDEILNMQGNSGPYMQYSYVRTQSVLEKAKGDTSSVPTPKSLNSEERELLRLLARFGEIVEEAANRYAPQVLSTYLFELAQAFNLFYQKSPILNPSTSLRASAEEVRAFRLQLTDKTGAVLKEGLRLLGIQTPQHM